MQSSIRHVTKRLRPGQDLREGIEKMVEENNIRAGCVLSVVGSLEKASLRMAGGKAVKTWDGPLEIVSGTGTVSLDDSHIHISLSDANGTVVGGHLKQGCVVGTTAEVVLLLFPETMYARVPDEQTGYDELEVG